MDVEVIENSNKCARCNYCRVCPIYTVEGWESASPRGKLYTIKSLVNGEIDVDARVVKELFKCTTCGSCEVICQVEIPLINLWENFRAHLNSKGYILPVHKKLREKTFREWNPYGESREKRADWFKDLKNLTSTNSDLLYFAGCTASYRTLSIARDTVELFNKTGLDFNYAGVDEYCCGSPFLRTGQRDLAQKLFLKNYKKWKEMGIRRIVTSCAGCYRTIAKDYPKIAEKLDYDFDFEVLHTVQILDEIVDEIDFEDVDVKATYHDPCHLGRHMGVYEEPRRVIEKMGIELIEMEKNRENAFCCGAGGGVKSQFKELALAIGELRVKEALNTNADYLISCCPFCKLHISQSLNNFDKNINVLDIVEVVIRTLNK
ncbi:(Fe-S)-binding protein [Archaeoglobales archaeon]|nr:MAG: (Fe-S)-binding protein [Archaeoglobales archaeon]